MLHSKGASEDIPLREYATAFGIGVISSDLCRTSASMSSLIARQAETGWPLLHMHELEVRWLMTPPFGQSNENIVRLTVIVWK